jgi:hypothetical protein
MSINQVRANIKGSVWRGIAQSGVDLSTLPAEQQNKLVDNVTNSVLLAMNDVIEDAQKSSKPEVAPADGEESVLWEGRPFLSLVEFYTITSERIKVVKGMFGKDTENIELIRLQDIDVTQNLSERMFNIGDINIKSADASNASITLRNVAQPQEVYEMLRRAWLDARKRYGLQFREQM